jgi:hypothetical protein
MGSAEMVEGCRLTLQAGKVRLEAFAHIPSPQLRVQGSQADIAGRRRQAHQVGRREQARRRNWLGSPVILWGFSQSPSCLSMGTDSDAGEQRRIEE